MNALVLIAHGSKRKLSNEEFLNLVDEVRNKDKNFSKIQGAFLELATPSIESTAEELVKSGVSKIYFYPFFLNSGRHVGTDVPEIINELKEKHPSVEFKLLEHFGKSNRISDIILDDISSAF